MSRYFYRKQNKFLRQLKKNSIQIVNNFVIEIRSKYESQEYEKYIRFKDFQNEFKYYKMIETIRNNNLYHLPYESK